MGLRYEHEKRASLLHRTATTWYRCFDQDLTEFPGSWSCRTYPCAKVQLFFILHNTQSQFNKFKEFSLLHLPLPKSGKCEIPPQKAADYVKKFALITNIQLVRFFKKNSLIKLQKMRAILRKITLLYHYII